MARGGVEFSQAGAHSEEASNSSMVGLRLLLLECWQGAVRKLAKCTFCNTTLDVKESLELGHKDKAGVVTRTLSFAHSVGYRRSSLIQLGQSQ